MLIYYDFLPIYYLSQIFLPNDNIFTTRLLLKLTSYFLGNVQLFGFKFFIIKRIELVSINIVIDKLVLYWWHFCSYHIRFLDNMWNRVYLFFYKKLLISCLSYQPWFDFNHTMQEIEIFLLPPFQEFDQGFRIFIKLIINIFTFQTFISYFENQLEFPYHPILLEIKNFSRVYCFYRILLYLYIVILLAIFALPRVKYIAHCLTFIFYLSSMVSFCLTRCYKTINLHKVLVCIA